MHDIPYRHEENGKVAGILKVMTMEDKLIHMFNDDKQNYPFSRLKLLIKKFRKY